MKSLHDYILEQQADATSKNIVFDFTALEDADDTIKSLQTLGEKSGIPVSVDGQKVTISFTSTTLDKAESIIDVLQQFIEIKGKSQRRASDENYAQRLHKFEDSMKELNEFRDDADAIEDDNEEDRKEDTPEVKMEKPGSADGGKVDDEEDK